MQCNLDMTVLAGRFNEQTWQLTQLDANPMTTSFAAALAAVLTACTAVASGSAVQAAPASGTQVTYKGTVAPLTELRTVGTPGKTFELVLVFDEVTDSSARVYWHVEENGSGRWPWSERFGVWTADSNWNFAGVGPSLLYDRGEGLSTVQVASPLLATTEALRPQAQWEDDKFSYTVRRQTKIAEKPAWEVEVANNYGWQRIYWRESNSPLALQVRQRVFMGMGQEFRLEMQLSEVKQLEGGEHVAVSQGFQALLDLRGKLDRPTRKEDPAFTKKQLQVLSEQLPALRSKVSSGSLVKVMAAARRDLEEQTDRDSAVQRLTGEQLGKPSPEFALEGTSRETFRSDQLAGNVTILHFWEYRDAPLKEPYGQVGYLDFLYQKRKGEGIKVYGVAVDRGLGEPSTRSQVVRSVKKLVSFMNLDYPVLLDDGRVLSRFGDPQALGAPLPLFVVVGRDGKIAHYHVGNYEVDRNAGLKQLDEIVTAMLNAASAGE